MKSILVACEGNICRSPMVQALLANRAKSTTVTSAGTRALHGMPADDVAIQLMAERSLDITGHRGKQITAESCLGSELVLVMDADQKRFVEMLAPQVRGRVFKLGEFIGKDIPDPYRRGEDAFRETLLLIDASIDEWIRRLEKFS